MAQLLLRSLFFLPQQTPAQPWLTGAIFTARSPGPIHWRLPASGTGSRPRQLEQGRAETITNCLLPQLAFHRLESAGAERHRREARAGERVARANQTLSNFPHGT